MSQEEFKEFYNYKYWREIQRNQLTISSNIIFTFCIATIGFIINYLLKEKNLTCPIIKNLFCLTIAFFLLSILTYLILNVVKLNDYRKTAKLINNDTSLKEISKQTRFIGKLTWYLFYLEIIFAVLGFIVTLFTFYNIILL